MVPSFLINHVYYWGHVMRDEVFGPEKVQLLDRCGAVEDAGLNWVMHTDAPVSPLGSLHKIRVAVARDLWKEPATVLAGRTRQRRSRHSRGHAQRRVGLPLGT